jgi:uncharacterized protein (UPF0276 family)
MARLGPVATMIERDGNVPPLNELLRELWIARKLGAHAQQDAHIAHDTRIAEAA